MQFHTMLRVLRRCLWPTLLLLCVTRLAHAQADGSLKSGWPYAAMSDILTGDILSSPAVAPDGTVYIGVEVGSSSSATPAGLLCALKPDGTEKWQAFRTPDWIDSAPVVGADGTIYFGCWDGKLYALKPDGSQKWPALDLGSFISASPALGPDGTIYIGTGDGDLCAVNPDGTEKWRFMTLYWIEAAPAVAPDGTIYVGSNDNTFYAVRPDGTEKWRNTTGSDIVASAAICADGTVYVGSRDLKLYAFSPDGALKWSFETSDTFEASPVLGADGTIYAATSGGRLHALRPDGTQKWQYPSAGQPALSSLYSTPAVRSDGSIVIGTSDNAVHAVRADGTLLWRASLGHWADSSPVVTPDGLIYIGCSDKKVYAFHSSATAVMTDWPQFLRDPKRSGRQPMGAAGGTTGRLMNVSVRTFAASGENGLIIGFNVAGSGSRTLLVRGAGPTLEDFGVTGVLPDPVIGLHRNGALIASNDNWGTNSNAAEITSTTSALGAFPFASSLEAALLSPVPPTLNSVTLGGVGGTTGIALMEVYDAGGDSTARVNNLSARSFVGTGSGVLIAGFVVDGGTRAVLIRGVGPTLANYLEGELSQPRLQVFYTSNNQQTIIAENTRWSAASNATAITTTGNTVGAFPLDAALADSALLLTLPPGNYSCQLSGVGNTTGIGLIEVYEVP